MKKHDASDQPFDDSVQQSEADEVLAGIEQSYRTLFEAASDAIFIVKGNRFVACNQSAVTIFGCSNKNDFIGHSPWEFSPPIQPDGSDSKQKAIMLVKAASDGYAQRFEWKHIKKDKTFFDAEVSLNRLTLDGKVYLQAIVRDISMRKQNEQALLESEARLKEAQQMAQLGHWYWDVKTGDVDWSEEVFKIFRLDPNTFTPQIDSIMALSPWPEDSQRHKELMDKVITTGEVGTFEQRFLFPDGSTGYYYSTFQGIFDQNNSLIAIQGTVQDITDRKMAELEREALIKTLEQKNAELERFTYTVSHDLKTPLVTIEGFLGIIKEQSAIKNLPSVMDYLERISNASKKMRTLLQDLLEFSRVGSSPGDYQSIPLQNIVDEALELLKPQLEIKSISVNIDPNLPVIYGNKERISEVIINLIENAIKYIGSVSDPQISIGGKDTNKDTVVYVKDNGIGIKPEYFDKIFRLFDKLDGNSEGSGVGLSIVKRIVEVHGGSIHVESAGPDQGSKFIFYLPHPRD